MTTIVSDNFNRTENPIASGWVKQSGIGTSLLTNGTQAKGITAAADNVAVYDNVAGNDQWAEAVLVASASDGGPWVRGSTGASQGYLLDCGAVGFGIYKYTGAFTILGASFGSGNIAGHTYRLEAKGQASTVLEAFDNGVSMTTRTDASSPHLSGRVGLHCFDTTIAWDSFQGGDFITDIGPTPVSSNEPEFREAA
jgi:hypothetical protein